MVFKSLTVVCFMLPLFDIGFATCQNGWVPFLRHQYCFVLEAMTWQDARIACKKKGSYLAVVDNSKESFWLRFQRVLYGHDFWIGATDLFKSREWRWESTGQPLNYEDFAPGEPNHLIERCVCMSYKDGRWNDYACKYKLPYICERK